MQAWGPNSPPTLMSYRITVCYTYNEGAFSEENSRGWIRARWYVIACNLASSSADRCMLGHV